MGDMSQLPSRIASVFTRPSIPGYIFIEGPLLDVLAATCDLVTVYHTLPPKLITLEQRVALLSPRIPVFCDFQVGSWVSCKYGRYRNDTGIVCGKDPHTEASVIVAFLPRILEKITETAK